MDVFEDRESKKSKGIKYSLLKQNMDGLTGRVSPLGGENGDNLRLLTASCLLPVGPAYAVPATFVL